jgi:hypothetical protein
MLSDDIKQLEEYYEKLECDCDDKLKYCLSCEIGHYLNDTHENLVAFLEYNDEIQL